MTSIKTPLIIGHRGASTARPENTFAAFQQAVDDGADGIEFDVRLSRDDVPVVIHDANLKRTTFLNASVSDLTAAELQDLNCGAFFHKVGAVHEKHPVPTLAQVFELFAKRDGLLYLELKGEPVSEKLIRRVIDTIEQFRMTEKTVVECFDHAAIKSLKALAPHARTAALFERRLRRPANVFHRNILAAARDANADELALHHSLVTDGIVQEAKRSGFEVVVWTVDDPEWIERARHLGIKSLITNDPARMLAQRN